MTRGTTLPIVAMTVMMLWGAAGPVLAGPLPQEPGDEYLVNDDVDYVVGFYFREYSLAANGVVDYRTARQILSNEPGTYHTMVIEAEEFPLFYWYDGDHDGQFEMWIDQNVRGCACDIVRYDPASPPR